MTERNERRLPEWAEKERAGDLAWIGENLHILWPAARVGYETVGRGAIIVDTTSRPTGAGHPFGYLDQPAIEQSGDVETRRLVQNYDPASEFVTTLFKSQERVSSYQVRVISPGTRENISNRVDPDPQQKITTEPKMEPPDLETN